MLMAPIIFMGSLILAFLFLPYVWDYTFAKLGWKIFSYSWWDIVKVWEWKDKFMELVETVAATFLLAIPIYAFLSLLLWAVTPW